jgi:hypothetical protein
MIDRIRQDIQERLDHLFAETEKLRRALIALDPRPQSATPPREARNSAAGDKASATPSSRSSVESPSGRLPSSRSACLTQLRNVTSEIPRSSAI